MSGRLADDWAEFYVSTTNQMNSKRTYTALCLLGFIVPYYFLARFIAEHGLHLSLLINQVMASPGSAFFAVDVVISSVVLWVFIYHETRKRTIEFWWVCILANLAVGVSLALPLFLLLREMQMEKVRMMEGGH
jgi:hypothetical protein